MEFDSRSERRRDTALKKDSWIVGSDEAELEVEVAVLFLEAAVDVMFGLA